MRTFTTTTKPAGTQPAPKAATVRDFQAELEALRAENARLQADIAAKAAAGGETKPAIRISEKGAVIVRHTNAGRWMGTTTLYAAHWANLGAIFGDVLAFILDNADSLDWKGSEELKAKTLAKIREQLGVTE